MPTEGRSTLTSLTSTTRAGHFCDHVNPVWGKALRLIGFDKTYVRALGSSLWDDEGREYLDLIGGYATTNVGRNHPVVREALTEFLASEAPSMVQFERSALAGEVAKALTGRVGRGLGKVFFTNSGTEGVEACLKFARCTTKRPAFVAARGGFHGLSTGALSLNGCESFREGFGPFPETSRFVPFNDLPALERELSSGDVAAFVLEPIQGKGVNLPAPGYLAEASRVCRRHGTLFVVDEVQTGIGRTGSFLAIDQEGEVEPDMVVLSKGLSGGYVPVGAVLLSDRVFRAVFSRLDRAIVHSSTFHVGGLAMVAALATLRVFDEERLAENAKRIGGHLREGLERLQERMEFIREIRQRGLMIGIEFGQPKSLTLKAAWAMTHALDDNLFTQAITIPLMEDHRILTQTAGHGLDVLKLTPSLALTVAEADRFLKAFEAVLQPLHRFPGPDWDLLKRLAANAIRRDAPTTSTTAPPCPPKANEPGYTSLDG